MENTSTEQKWYDKTWLVIILCIIFFPVGLYALWKNQSISKGWKIGVTALIAIALIANLGGNDSKTSSSSTSTTDTEKQETKKENESGWEYSEDVDKMDNTKRSIASLTSDNTLTFDFPYGESDFTLNIRSWKGSTDVYLTCSKCQFIAGVTGEKTYRVKFDDEQPFNISANHTTSGGADVVFLGSEKKLISKLKTANKLLIEPEFFDVGFKSVEFSTKGFKWE